MGDIIEFVNRLGERNEPIMNPVINTSSHYDEYRIDNEIQAMAALERSLNDGANLRFRAADKITVAERLHHLVAEGKKEAGVSKIAIVKKAFNREDITDSRLLYEYTVSPKIIEETNRTKRRKRTDRLAGIVRPYLLLAVAVAELTHRDRYSTLASLFRGTEYLPIENSNSSFPRRTQTSSEIDQDHLVNMAFFIRRIASTISEKYDLEGLFKANKRRPLRVDAIASTFDAYADLAGYPVSVDGLKSNEPLWTDCSLLPSIPLYTYEAYHNIGTLYVHKDVIEIPIDFDWKKPRWNPNIKDLIDNGFSDQPVLVRCIEDVSISLAPRQFGTGVEPVFRSAVPTILYSEDDEIIQTFPLFLNGSELFIIQKDGFVHRAALIVGEINEDRDRQKLALRFFENGNKSQQYMFPVTPQTCEVYLDTDKEKFDLRFRDLSSKPNNHVSFPAGTIGAALESNLLYSTDDDSVVECLDQASKKIVETYRQFVNQVDQSISNSRQDLLARIDDLANDTTQ